MSEFNEYQKFVNRMKVYPKEQELVYPALKLCGEAGEVAEKIGKSLRGDKELNNEDLVKELGDVLWYIAALADDLGYTLDDVAALNVSKLMSRKERGVLKGDGDNR